MNLKIKVPQQVTKIINKFEEKGYEIYIVGGVVRDILLKRQLYDWDFTTNAEPEQVLKLFDNAYYDNKFGMVGIPIGDDIRPFEITTFRTDHGYTDSRHPDEVRWGKSLEEDLQRRDFTINSLALKRAKDNFELIDLYNGERDLKDKLIRAVGDPKKRFEEDALRMMRAVRIATQLQFNIEEETFRAIQLMAGNIKKVSAERIRDELFKLLASDYPADGYQILRNTGLAMEILPEVETGFGIEQQSPGRHHIFDVGTHSLLSLKYCPSFDPVTRLATLIHDIGKVKTQRKYPDGRITFYNHEMESTKIAEFVAERLRFSNTQKNKFVRLVRWHQFTVDERQTDSAIRRFIRNVEVENIPDMISLRVGDRLGGGAKETSWRLEEFKERLIEVQKQPFSVSDLKISGNDVMKVKNITPGPMVGKYLEMIFYEVTEMGLSNKREILIEKLKEINL